MGCERLPRVPGTAIYLTSRADAAPAALATQVKHNRCLHQTVVLLTVVAERIPRVSSHRRASFEQLHRGLIRATLRFGFAEVPNVPRSLAGSNHAGLRLNDAMTTYFTSREITVPSVRHELAAWQKPIFRFLAKMSANASDYFCLPPRQVVEIAVHIEI
jgi:KUP system potassium uptake protein